MSGNARQVIEPPRPDEFGAILLARDSNFIHLVVLVHGEPFLCDFNLHSSLDDIERDVENIVSPNAMHVGVTEGAVYLV
jgi:hypothetical protein